MASNKASNTSTKTSATTATDRVRSAAAGKARTIVRTTATSLTKAAVAVAEQLMAIRVTFTDEAGKPAVGTTMPDAYKKYVRANITGPLEEAGVENIDSVMELANRHIRKTSTRRTWYGMLVKNGTITPEHYKALMVGVLAGLAPRKSRDTGTVTDESKAERKELTDQLLAADVITSDEATKATATRLSAKRSARSQLRTDVNAATKDGIDVESLLGTIRSSLRLIFAETDEGTTGELSNDTVAAKLGGGKVEAIRKELETITTMVANITTRVGHISNVVSLTEAKAKAEAKTAGSNRGGRSTGTKTSTKTSKTATNKAASK